MFWGDRIATTIAEAYKDRIENGEALVIRDEKTASGRVHVGSMRSVALHGILSEILTERGVANEFFYEINDMDPMDGLPIYLDKETYKPHMGKPLFRIPSPDGEAKNFAEYFANEFIGVIEEAGFHPTLYRVSDLYFSGRMNDVIRIALERAADIRRIYKKISNSEKPDDWLPLNVICESCGKVGTTQVTFFDGERVAYTCKKDLVEWAEGCGYSGTISPFDGNATLPFKVEWAAKFKVMNVCIEGAGKDHYTKGGSRRVANTIAREIFDYEPPFDIPHEFILVGGKKMSSSKGAGSRARSVADLLPPHIFRLVLLGKDINQQTNFDPEGDTVPILFDRYDALAEKYFAGTKDDDARLFTLIHRPDERGALTDVFRPRFREIAFLIQMPHLSLEEEAARMNGSALGDADKAELAMRERYARIWLEGYAPEDFKYELQTKHVPESARAFSPEQKEALREVLEYVEDSTTALDGQDLHTKLHEIRKALNIEPVALFRPIYLAFLGKESGPKAGWFLSVLPKNFLESRLREVTQ